VVTEMAILKKAGKVFEPSEKLSRNSDSFYILRLFALSRENKVRLHVKEKTKPHSFGKYSNLGQCFEPAIADDYMD
jgi:hypothetical protein